MALINEKTKEIHCKVLYVGAKGSGKTSNLRAIYKQTSTEYKTGLLTISSEDIEDKYYEFLPLSMGHVEGYHIKLHLYTLPILGFYPVSELFFVKDIDGLVYVVDSQAEKQLDNTEYVFSIKNFIQEYNIKKTIPQMFQYNKRDCKSCIDIDILQKIYNEKNIPYQEARASKGEGVMETLLQISKQLITSINPHGDQHVKL